MKALRIILLSLAFIAFQAHANEERNLAIKQVNNAVSEQRIALVIGNSAYTNSPLKNPVNDAKDMAKKLRSLGFIVIERSNLQTRQIGATLREFRSKLVPGAVALVFYAGHGLQIKGDNYLPAVDADINSEEDVPNQSLAVKQIMDVLDESKARLNLVFLDACRNNPYARSFRSADKGLARISAPSGTLISYATRPGSVAADGGGRNGLYTSKLLAQMDSNVQIEQALKRVVTEVKAASQGKQEPWMEGSIEGDFCFAGCAADGGTQVANFAPVPAATHAKGKEEIEDDTWKAAEEANIPDSYETYLLAYSNGRYAAQARIKLAILKKPTENLPQASALAGNVPAMVRIPGKNYEMGKYEVTQGEWKSVMGNNPSNFSSCGDTCPVEKVSWNDAQEFIQKLNARTGKQYRLPTEAEWGYACYGGIQAEYCGGNDINAVAWYDGNSGYTTHPAGQKKANGYGLYDMSGNVWEWTNDCWEGDCAKRVVSGGSWNATPYITLVAGRSSRGEAESRNIGSGFRLARTLPSEVAQSEKPTEHPLQSSTLVGNLPVMVRISGKNYEMGKYEVTQGEWKSVMGNNPSNFNNCGDICPVDSVNWNDVQEFIRKLNAKTGKQYRLPTEDEWEYACYGGSQTDYCGGNDIDSVAWYESNSGKTTHPVGQKQANGYGLYDMSGNMLEWTSDLYDSSHNWRVLRGGSWSNVANNLRSAFRGSGDPTSRGNSVGLRVARTLP